MDSIVSKAINSAQTSEIAFSKFITPNDTGATGGHQAGYHIHKNAWKLFFDKEGVKNSNKDVFITIKWQDSFETNSRFIYYGIGTRNEYRLTRFKRGFPFLNDGNIGDLLVICKMAKEYYHAYVLKTEEEIEEFFAALNISSTTTNCIIPKQFERYAEDNLLNCYIGFIKSLKKDFPSTIELSDSARNCYNAAFKITSNTISKNPDRELLQWLNSEFELFKMIENDRYNQKITVPFKSVEELIETANSILNRRKSRAGKSLENHLSEIFKAFHLNFGAQVITEDNKKPDFLFPGAEAYNDKKFNPKKLVMLASKTTCKDRWRQILNEADKIKTKHLFTLQQGISKNQLEEMYKYNVQLVVPEKYVSTFPKAFQSKILTLKSFVNYVQNTQK